MRTIDADALEQELFDAAVKRKMEINRERPYKHGKE